LQTALIHKSAWQWTRNFVK